MGAEQSLSIPAAFSISVLGFAIVFFVLVVLMAVIKILRAIIAGRENGKAASAAVAAPVAPSVAKASNMVPAVGSLGEVKLHGVDDRTAAMLMAIVADELKAPLNELRFIAIREKK